ncbi:16139_t:CDS:2 [Racocetra fulgida]|uniref:16139_t:CDS:1 n=1 Tax=Racocetra fulgida TaxID=60492 RepID=A0A9N9AWE7_9GLOM|nr:16139_t:CDS:2 [Racocetra fulgida]
MDIDIEDTESNNYSDDETKLSLFERGQPTTDAINEISEIFDIYCLESLNLIFKLSIFDEISTTRDYFNRIMQHHSEQTSRISQYQTVELV